MLLTIFTSFSAYISWQPKKRERKITQKRKSSFVSDHSTSKSIQQAFSSHLNQINLFEIGILSHNLGQMKMNSLLVSLLVMSTLIYEAQGIRLAKITRSSALNDETQKGKLVIEGSTIKGGTGKEIICQDDEINCSGLNRKLMTKTTTSISTTKSNGEEQNGKKESLSVNSAPTSVAQHREDVSGEQYPDIVDIAGMDYSPAKRKPPIHN